MKIIIGGKAVDIGRDGKDGKSAYEIAVENGFVGSETDWLDSLKAKGTEDSFLVQAPVGAIVIWSGTEENIPKGWHLCNGEDGTPDLRGRFILGAGTHKVGEIGGEETHTLTIDEIPAHGHEIRLFDSSQDNSGRVPMNGDYEQSTEDGTYNAGAIQNTGGSKPHNNMPPYYTLCYIIKLEKDESNIAYSSGSPLGTIISFMGTKAPEGYLICDGAEYTIKSYPALAAFFQEQFGSAGYFGGDGETTFAVPDLRDQFLRGFHGENETRYSGEIGAQQPGTQLPTYWGYVGSSDSRLTVVGHVGNAPGYFDRDGSESNLSSYRINASATVVSGGQNDVMKMILRPANIAVLYCIKATVDISEISLDAYNTEDGWYVRKYNDGYVEMWFYGTVTVTGGSSGWGAFGSMYVAELSAIPLPVALAEKLSETLTPQIGSTSGLGLWSYCTGNKAGMLLTHTEIWSICRPTQPSGSITVPYAIHITGRWK